MHSSLADPPAHLADPLLIDPGRFRRAVRGYRTQHVAAFLERLLVARRAGLSALQLAQIVAEQRPSTAIGGYAREDVDDAINRIIQASSRPATTDTDTSRDGNPWQRREHWLFNEPTVLDPPAHAPYQVKDVDAVLARLENTHRLLQDALWTVERTRVAATATARASAKLVGQLERSRGELQDGQDGCRRESEEYAQRFVHECMPGCSLGA